MKQLLDALNSRCAHECAVKSFDGWHLVISGGTSIEYARPIASFTGVSYVSLPIEFSNAAFTIASPSERERIGKIVPLEPEDQVLSITAETMASLESQQFILVATDLALLAPGTEQS